MTNHPLTSSAARLRPSRDSKTLEHRVELFTPWCPERDVELTGVVRAPGIEIPEGVVLGVAGDLRLESAGPIVMAEAPRLIRPRIPRPSHLLVLRAEDWVEFAGRRYDEPAEILVSTWERQRAGMPIRILIHPWQQAA
jgi:hypothetical protein